jgi:hypothetical protein
MRSPARVALAAVVVVAAGPVLSACTSLDSLDPSEMFDTKKKIAGDRKPVFPEGVPGVAGGVPPELVKGYREPEGGVTDPAKAAAEAAAGSDPKPKKPPPPQRTAATKPKPKPKPADAPSSAAPPPPAQGAGWPQPQPQAAWPGGR